MGFMRKALFVRTGGLDVALGVAIGVLALLPGSASAKPLPRLPTELAGALALELRPAVVDVTGDGTGFLGGLTGAHSVSMPSRVRLGWAGRLRWTTWGARQAKATGAVWVNNGIPDDASGTFHSYAAAVRAYDPVNGIFRCLTYTAMGHTTTLRASYDAGYWRW